MTSDESKSVLACLEACERKAIYLARIHRLQVELAAYELQRRALVSKDREAAAISWFLKKKLIASVGIIPPAGCKPAVPKVRPETKVEYAKKKPAGGVYSMPEFPILKFAP